MKANEVPVFLTGCVRHNDAPSLCRDGADYLIHTEGWPREVRLQAGDGEIGRRLAEAAAQSGLVVVGGHSRRGNKPGCDYLEVHRVDPVALFVERLKAA